MGDNCAPQRPVPQAKLSPPRISAMPRERLEDALERLWSHRLGLVVGPAGSGKTTLLARFCMSARVPVAWYRADSGDAPADVLVHNLYQALSPTLRGLNQSPPDSADDLVEVLEHRQHDRVLLVLDDLHTLLGTPAEDVLDRLVQYEPPALRVILASRRPPGFDLSRLRVSGELLLVGPDELRFRSWEVERLFRHFYDEPLPPEDLAELARRTEGWAAGLQLFHLATRGKPTSERRRVVAALSTRSRIVREYLARNVLDDLPEDVHRFLVRTSVLGRLTGPLCDDLLERPGSEAILRELERQQIFTVAVDEWGGYRYHEVLRSHLEAALVEDVGESRARELYRRAGHLLQAVGALPEALRAYCRAEDWDAVAALLGRDGEQLAADPGAWIDALPAALLEQDPWLMLATARRYLAVGRPSDALSAYHRAELAFGAATAGEACRRERRALSAWLEPLPAVPNDWLGLLRAALQRDPNSAAHDAARMHEPAAAVTEGLSTLLAGRLEDARLLLRAAAERPDVSPVLGLVSRLVAGASRAAFGQGEAENLGALADEAEALDVPWLVRFIRTALALTSRGGRREATAARLQCQYDGDPWGAATAALIEGLAGLWRGEPTSDLFEEAARSFRQLGAGVAEAWARSGLALALARDGHPEAREAALAAGTLARSAGVRGAEALVFAALALLDKDRSQQYLEGARSVAEECGMRWPPAAVARDRPSGSDNEAAHVAVKCFGRFAISLNGRALDCSMVKPRHRVVLRLLALHAGRPVHRETLIEALWPNVDSNAAMRNLHVAVSALRQVLEPGVARGEWALIVREGDTYRLAVAADADIDVLTFERAVAHGRRARAARDGDGAVAALTQALDVYAGDLLPEDGPADWAVQARDRYRMDAADAAHSLAEILLERGNSLEAATACERAVRVDRYRDSAWRLLMSSYESAGDHAAARRARHAYRGVLAELGLSSALAPAGTTDA